MSYTSKSSAVGKPPKSLRWWRRHSSANSGNAGVSGDSGAPSAKPAPRPRRPGSRGWGGRGGGASSYVQTPDMWRGTTVQVCGLWPFTIGTGSPMVGVPLGRHIQTGATVCCDPISWFQRAQLISNPSAFVLGLPGLGKSTVVGRMLAGLAGFGTMPLVLGDLKPDHVDRIRAMDGQVIPLGHGRGYLNIMDPGEAVEAARQLRASGHDDLANELDADTHSRRLTILSAHMTILRKKSPTDVEESLIDQAIRLMDQRVTDRPPVLADVLAIVREAPPELREVAVDRGSMKEYQRITRGLEQSLLSLIHGGRLGSTFSQPTTNPMRRDRPVVYDISGIAETETDLRAAALLACWSSGFSTINVAHALAAAGLEPQRNYFVVLDELWQALRSGSGMVDRVDSLTRLNRNVGVGQAMITHTMKDLLSLPTEEDRMKAAGLVERAGMVICGGLTASEMPDLNRVIRLSQVEQGMLEGWSTPPTFDQKLGRETEPPGRGKFLIKVGGRPGIPVRVHITEVEKATSDTNKLWHTISRVGQRHQADAMHQLEEPLEPVAGLEDLADTDIEPFDAQPDGDDKGPAEGPLR